MFKKGQKWTPEEITTLEEMYTNPHYTAEQITHALGGRRWRTIQHQASALGLRRPRSDTWNCQEIALLKQMYVNPQFSRDDILSAFPRHCMRTIETQARKHHLHRPHHNRSWTPHEIATLKYMYPIHSSAGKI